MPEANAPKGFVPAETFRELVEAAGPLYADAAAAVEGQQTPAEASAPMEDQIAAQATRTCVLAIQAILAGAPLSDRGRMVVMGVTCGAILGQVPMDQYQALYSLFQAQFAETIAHVSLAQRPGMNG